MQEGGSRRSVELMKVQNLQPIQNSQTDSQLDVPIVEAQSLHTPPLRKSSRVHNIPLNMGLSLRMTIHPISLRMMISRSIQKLS